MTQAGPPVESDAPPWLVEFLMQPPLWFKAALFLGAGVCLVLAARKVYGRDFHITMGEQREVLLIVATIEAIAVGVLGAMGALDVGFVVGVPAGVVSGFLAVEALRRCEWAIERVLADESARVATAWLAVAGGAVVLPELASGSFPVPRGLDIAIGGVAVAMLGWLVVQEAGEGETVGDALRAEKP